MNLNGVLTLNNIDVSYLSLLLGYSTFSCWWGSDSCLQKCKLNEKKKKLNIVTGEHFISYIASTIENKAFPSILSRGFGSGNKIYRKLFFKIVFILGKEFIKSK